jgi:hypothetical protein
MAPVGLAGFYAKMTARMMQILWVLGYDPGPLSGIWAFY